MGSEAKLYGYYYISIEADTRYVVRSNNERAFVISQLQDLLSPRMVIGEVPAYKQLASCIDLLAFSIQRSSIQLLIFAIDAGVMANFTNHIVTRLAQYQSESGLRHALTGNMRIIAKQLTGPHQTLQKSVTLHLVHDDWEYDRYSSIGFYLHDRRGDWMRTWRLAQLYDNNPAYYRQLIDGQLHSNLARFNPELPVLAS